MTLKQLMKWFEKKCGKLCTYSNSVEVRVWLGNGYSKVFYGNTVYDALRKIHKRYK